MGPLVSLANLAYRKTVVPYYVAVGARIRSYKTDRPNQWGHIEKSIARPNVRERVYRLLLISD